MELRQLEIYLPEKHTGILKELLNDQQPLGGWHSAMAEGQVLFRVLLSSELTEEMLDKLEKHFADVEGYRAVLLPVQASVPRVAEEETDDAKAEAGKEAEAPKQKNRISREELYAALQASGQLTPLFLILTALATVVAVIGLLRGDVPVIIGAMVLAPLLGPNMAQALGTTLGDSALMRRAVRANIAGILTTIIVAVLSGMFTGASPDLPEIASRTVVSIGDVTLALAAGAAGAFALTSGIATTVIGVAAALALLPPLVVFGLLLGGGAVGPAINALLLSLANIISLNLAAILTFLVQGLRPAKWWEEYRAKKTIVRAVLFWAVLLAVLMLLAILLQR